MENRDHEHTPFFPAAFPATALRGHGLGHEPERVPREGGSRARAAARPGQAAQALHRHPGWARFPSWMKAIETVLDILREKAHVNTVWLNTYTWDHGTGGRQLEGYPFPDHGRQEPDNDFFGGAVFDYDQKYFRHTVLNQFRSPDYQGRNILQEVLPKARERNLDVVAWDYFYPNQFNPQRLKNMDRVAEIDVRGKPTWAPCNNNEDWRQHMFGRIEVYLRQYPDVAGIAWGQERMGPLMNLIGGGWSQPFISCFCPLCRKKARARELSVERAQRGYLALESLLAAAKRDERPSDGYFVSFWRLCPEYPEILGWEKLWTDSYQDIRSGGVPIWQNQSRPKSRSAFTSSTKPRSVRFTAPRKITPGRRTTPTSSSRPCIT